MEIEQFSALGRQIEAVWRQVNYDEERFADIAADVLSSASLDTAISPESVLDCLVESASSEQGVTATVGDLPLLVFQGHQFLVQLLLWTGDRPAPYQLRFSGALRMLLGSTIHSRYKFDLRHVVNSRFHVGEVRLQAMELLGQGDTRVIAAGTGLTHSLYHLDQPTVSIVARIARDTSNPPHMTLHPPYFAVDADALARDPVAAQVSQDLLAMKDSGNPDIVQALAEQLPRLDFSRVFQICLGASRALGDHNPQLIDLVRQYHGDLADRLRACQLHEQGLHELINLRSNVADDELRFFLGVLLNAPTQADIYFLIKSRYADVDPEDKVVEWLSALAMNGHIPIQSGPLLIRGMLRGLNIDETLATFQGPDDLSAPHEVRDVLSQFRQALAETSVLKKLWIDNHFRQDISETESSDVERQTLRGFKALFIGDFQSGWVHYERRHRVIPTAGARLGPWWEGQPLEGKTLIIHREQGVGDEVWLASCFPDVLKQTKHCSITCSSRLESLFRRSFPSATIVADERHDAEPWRGVSADYQVPAGNLARYLRHSKEAFPHSAGFLTADPKEAALWQRRLNQLGGGKKVGISWQGGRGEREAPRSFWDKVFQVEDCHFINLQYGDVNDDLWSFRKDAEIPIVDFDDLDLMDDIDRVVALMSVLDLVVAVPNTNVHLAASVGTPVWMPFLKTWETFWVLNGVEVPWYPSVEVFCATEPGEWTSVAKRMRLGIEAYGRE